MSTDSAPPAARCPQCGSDVRAFTDPMRVVPVDVWNPEAVRSLALNEVEDRCPACQRVLTSHPTYLVWDSRDLTAGVDVLPGSHALPAQLDELTRAVVGGGSVDTRVRQTADELRRTFVTRTWPTIKLLNGFFSLDLDMRTDWVRRHWRDVDARALIVIPLTLTGRLPGAGVMVVSADGEVDVDPDEALNQVHSEMTMLETFLLMMLASEVPSNAELDLAAELRRLVVNGVFEPDVQSLVTPAISQTADQMDFTQTYVHLAMNAAMCGSLGINDPLADSWAEIYLEFEIFHASHESVDRLSLPASMVGPTLTYPSLWDCLARRVDDPDTQWSTVEAVLIAAGHRAVLSDFTHMLRTGGRFDEADVDAMIDAMEQFPVAESPNEFCWLALGFFQQLFAAGEPDQAEQLLDAILLDPRPDADTRWMVIARFGEACKEAGSPGRFLARVGDEESPAEADLDPVVRVALGVERSNAMRLEGRFRKALQALVAVEPLVTGSDRVLVRNKAILLRECGEPDRSIAILEGLLPDAVGTERLAILESLIASHQQLGHRDDVHRYIAAALPLATGPLAHRALALRANRISVEVNAGNIEALDELGKFDPGSNVQALLAIGGTWANVLRRKTDFNAEALGQVLLRLVDYLSEAHGSVGYQMIASRLLGVISDTLGVDTAAQAWEHEVALRQDADSPDPVPLVGLAHHRLLAGDEAAAVDLLLQVPEAMANLYGGIANAGVAVDATRLLTEMLEGLAESMIAVGAGPDLRRLVAELQRDGAGRAQLVRNVAGDQREDVTLSRGLGDAALRALAPRAASLHVVDWFTAQDGYLGQRTTIGSDGSVSLVALDPPDFALLPIAERIRARLDGWHSRRVGDPFDLSEWLDLEAWFTESLGDVGPGDHVIVIDSPRHAGIPWHAIRGGHWTTSYAPGWSSLLTLRPADLPPAATIGIVVAPASEDRPDVVAALYDTKDAVLRLAGQAGLETRSCLGEAADSSAVQALLATVDVAVVLCHGYAAPREREVALMLAHDGSLPTTHAVAAGSAARRGHRWSWRDAVGLARAPRLVVSAACSSGTSHLAGMGERLGLYGSLRLRGTQSVVAPLWEVGADDARAFVTTCLAAHLGDGLPLAMAMSAASNALANEGVPDWRRNCFALEGDWR